MMSFLVRGITLSKALLENKIQVRSSKKYFLLVGSQKFDFTTLKNSLRFDIVSMFLNVTEDISLENWVKNMKLLVNGKNSDFQRL